MGCFYLFCGKNVASHRGRMCGEFLFHERKFWTAPMGPLIWRFDFSPWHSGCISPPEERTKEGALLVLLPPFFVERMIARYA